MHQNASNGVLVIPAGIVIMEVLFWSQPLEGPEVASNPFSVPVQLLPPPYRQKGK